MYNQSIKTMLHWKACRITGRKNWQIKTKYVIAFSQFSNNFLNINLGKLFSQIFKKCKKIKFLFFKQLIFWIILFIHELKSLKVIFNQKNLSKGKLKLKFKIKCQFIK